MSERKPGEPVQFVPGEDCGDGNQSAVFAWRDPHIKSMRADVAQMRADVASLRKDVAELAELERVAARQNALRRQLAVGK